MYTHLRRRSRRQLRSSARARTFFQENLDEIAGTINTHYAGSGAVLRGTDQRTMRFSVAAGVDVTPLIDYWGIKPENPTELAAEIARQGLGPSRLIVDTLIRRATEVLPQNSSEFNDHFDRVYPGRPTGGQPALWSWLV